MLGAVREKLAAIERVRQAPNFLGLSEEDKKLLDLPNESIVALRMIGVWLAFRLDGESDKRDIAICAVETDLPAEFEAMSEDGRLAQIRDMIIPQSPKRRF